MQTESWRKLPMHDWSWQAERCWAHELTHTEHLTISRGRVALYICHRFVFDRDASAVYDTSGGAYFLHRRPRWINPNLAFVCSGVAYDDCSGPATESLPLECTSLKTVKIELVALPNHRSSIQLHSVTSLTIDCYWPFNSISKTEITYFAQTLSQLACLREIRMRNFFWIRNDQSQY